MVVVVKEKETSVQTIEKNRDKKFREFKRNRRFYYNEFEHLKIRYPDEYVAINEKMVVDHDKNVETLIERLREQCGDLGSFVIEYINASGTDLIL